MLYLLAVAGAPVPVPAPQHHAAVVPRPLHDRQRLPRQRRRRDVPAVRRARRRREPEVDGAPRQAGRPLPPRRGERGGVAGAVAAGRVVVELDVDAVEHPRAQRLAQHPVRERALRRRRQPHLLTPWLPPAVSFEVPGEVVVVGGAAELDVEVDAVEHGVAEGAGLGAAAKVKVPEVVGDGLGVGLGGEGVPADAAADGEEDEHPPGLAVLHVGPHGAPVVAGEVQLVPAAAEAGEEGDDHRRVQPAAARLPEPPLRRRLPPVHRDPPGLLPGRRRRRRRRQDQRAAHRRRQRQPPQRRHAN
ncbi:Os04g0347100 [Oryza sativa Japonica Group]|uniref:Os04g0347100 protein n=1 Tax=Oryza sativa subsp. japonica TaxID=39947 RepID=Q0JE09_ORYSJ|nr:Os04g0347100 [Oryza sativa Japonica Group]|eukprot:NP_001052514.1 Os04g0347100 [Oryza sativa Japonica Group]